MRPCTPESKQIEASPKQGMLMLFQYLCNYNTLVKEQFKPFHMAAKQGFLPKSPQDKHTARTTVSHLVSQFQFQNDRVAEYQTSCSKWLF